MIDADEYLRTFDPRVLSLSEGRRVETRLNPLLFALIYMRHHLRQEDGGPITLSEFHTALCDDALAWVRPATQPRESRLAYVAPRSCGKSTWAFTILPIWAAAHEHRHFAAAFADSAGQAEQHLNTFRHELATNELLKKDFPRMRPGYQEGGLRGTDNRTMTMLRNGFVFAAKGIDSSNLGMKVGSRRPDLIILDDIEPGEASYSAGQAAKRLSTLTDVVLPLNEFATVVAVGTVTMPGSIIHQLVRTVTSSDSPEPWIVAEKFTCRYFPAILANPDGTERSVWPDKWPIDYLQAHRHERSFLKNFQNDPLGADGAYWTVDDFEYGTLDPTHVLLSIDPAVTTKASSDFTGIAVIAFGSNDRGERACAVLHAEEVKLTGADLRTHVLNLLRRYPRIGLVLVEINQGGDLFNDVLHSLPVKLKTVHQTVKKEIRAATLLNHYQRGRVTHARPLPRLEQQMVAFPKAPHDDMIDAVGSGVTYFLNRDDRSRSAAARQTSYA